ncbi:hypothetical protein QA648_33490 (plasmid) [Rhizobium sp. CB3171]|uniref:hypothetical protein n=1 Tax=Rhizobium sp. CB3171 TaxID=3039157 RepID=UPI0024B15FF2|nr:hypothetical protein [Rhizobium sp. CB3171]WFU06711.1 hypothetical protein QA648_33490 [Rhizobium sp. CB3171]
MGERGIAAKQNDCPSSTDLCHRSPEKHLKSDNLAGMHRQFRLDGPGIPKSIQADVGGLVIKRSRFRHRPDAA